MKKSNLISLLIGVSSMLFSCNREETNKNSKIENGTTKAKQKTTPLFKKLNKEESGFYFLNVLKESEKLNILNYEYLYNGSGVAIGDINNDGLPDIFMGANLFGGRLYLNLGNMKFQQISETANIFTDGYSSGAVFIDINNDGYDDIYICRTLSENPELRRNILLINNQNLTFTNKAEEYGIDDPSFSTSSNFFDYDNDGDLDLYLLNHRVDFKDALTLKSKGQKLDVENLNYTSDRLYENMGDGIFKDVTNKAGLINNAFGLAVSVADLNQDGLQDIYISNDYADKDHIYINNGNKTFTDKIDSMFSHFSKNSMGSDIADFNNDGFLDIINLDMIPENNYRQKQLKSQSPYDLYYMAIDHGLGHQVMRNTLHLNNGKGLYSEMGQLAGVSHTDWSWSPILADFDNDGFKDLFISNGYYKDVTDMDYIKYESNEVAQKSGGIAKTKYMDLVNKMKSTPQQNYIYKNNKDLTYKNMSNKWGLQDLSFSNGSAVADLDLDGDLDLIINNLNHESFLYENQSNNAENNFITFKLLGAKKNKKGIGAKISILYNGLKQYIDNSPYKGYLSNHHNLIHFGLNTITKVDSILVDWGNNNIRLYQNLSINKLHKLDINGGQQYTPQNKNYEALLTKTNTGDLSKYSHSENNYNDFKHEPLLEHKNSNKGPYMTKGDINSDGLEDIYFSGSFGSEGKLFLQNKKGEFNIKKTNVFLNDTLYEDQNSTFFDFDNDGDLDLYVTSGGYQFPSGSEHYLDRLYLNDGKGNFSRTDSILPNIKRNTTIAISYDIDQDQDQDLIIFGATQPKRYPISEQSYVLLNTEGKFIKKDLILPNKGNLGIINDAVIMDINNDGLNEIILAREWDNVAVLSLIDNSFKDITTNCNLEKTSGWWNIIHPIDIDNDGDLDFIAGNRGNNSFYKASLKSPAKIIAKDFDDNGSLDALPYYYFNDNNLHPKHTLDEIFSQLPLIRRKFNRYKGFSSATLEDIFSKEELQKSIIKKATTFKSSIFINDGKGKFSVTPLPNLAQLSEIYGIESSDINNDGFLDLILIGNNYGVDVEMGRSDAGKGLVLFNNQESGFYSLPTIKSSLGLKGDLRRCYSIGETLIITQNNGPTTTFKLKKIAINSYCRLFGSNIHL